MYSPNFALVICLVVFTAHSVQPFGGYHFSTVEIRNITHSRNKTDQESFIKKSFETFNGNMDDLIDDMTKNVKDMKKEMRQINQHIKNAAKNGNGKIGNSTIYIIKNNNSDLQSSSNEQRSVQNRGVNPPPINATNINNGNYTSDTQQYPVQKSKVNPVPIRTKDYIYNVSYASDAQQYPIQNIEANPPPINATNINDEISQQTLEDLKPPPFDINNLFLGSFVPFKDHPVKKRQVNGNGNDLEGSFEAHDDSNGSELKKPYTWEKLFVKQTQLTGSVPKNRDDDNKDKSLLNEDYSFNFNRNRQNNPQYNQAESAEYIYDDNNRNKDNYIPSFYETYKNRRNGNGYKDYEFNGNRGGMN